MTAIAPQPGLKLNFVLTVEDLKAAHAITPQEGSWQVYWMAIVVLIASAFVATKSQFHALVCGLGAYLIALTLGSVLSRDDWTKKYVGRTWNMEFIFTDEHVEAQYDGKYLRMSWTSFSSYLETPLHFFLRQKEDNSPITIPKRACPSSDEMNELRRLLDRIKRPVKRLSDEV